MVSTTPRPLYPREIPGTHCTGGWVGLRASLDVCEKSRPHRDSIPGPSSPQPVAIPTEELGLIGRVILTISVQSSDCLALKAKVLRYFERLGNVYPTIQRNIPEHMSSLIRF
jgi:hypothetical protein